jgi:hypothetical protein
VLSLAALQITVPFTKVNVQKIPSPLLSTDFGTRTKSSSLVRKPRSVPSVAEA